MAFLDKFKKNPTGAKAEPKKASTRPAAEKKADKADKKEDKVEAKVAATRGPLAKDGAGEAYRVLLHPLFTEKGSRMQADGIYLFAVAKNANKMTVANAIKDLYGVKPVSVRIIVAKGKEVRFGRYSGKEKDVKKAMVKLPAGQTLTVLEGI